MGIFFKREKEWKNIKLGRLGGGKDLGGVEGRENMTKTYCIKKVNVLIKLYMHTYIYIYMQIYITIILKLKGHSFEGNWIRTLGLEKGNVGGVEEKKGKKN